MDAFKLRNGKMLIPVAVEGDGFIGDGVELIDPSDKRYREWLPWAKTAPVEIEREYENR